MTKLFALLAIALAVACCSHAGTAPKAADCSAAKDSASARYGPADQIVEVSSTESVWAWLETHHSGSTEPAEATRVSLFVWTTGACVVTSVP